MQSPYDAALLGILQHQGDIAQFLDTFCSFLYRRTDFYVHLTPDGKMGFPPGVAKKMLLETYKRYDDLASADRARKQRLLAKAEEIAKKENAVPVAVAEEEVTSSCPVAASKSSKDEADSCLQSDGTASKQTDVEACVESSEMKEVHSADNLTADNQSAATPPAPSCPPPVEQGVSSDSMADNSKAAAVSSVVPTGDVCTGAAAIDDVKPEESTKKSSKTGDEDDDDDPELTRLQKLYQANPESYNGAIRDKYTWSQSISDVDVRIKVGEYVRKGRDVKVAISVKRLRVECVTEGGRWEVLVDDELSWEVNKEQSMWSLVPGEHVHVNLEKLAERWWDCVLVSEPKISTRKIDPTRPMTDLDDAAQAKIDELMYNERQKAMGLPQSHEGKVHEMLRKAWDVEGSPFKGQPFDPSTINVAPSGS